MGDFSWVSEKDEEVYRDHLYAWRNHGARIAGFGWWKPVLCRRHLSSDDLPWRTGLLAFSDAGSILELPSAPSWRETLSAMRNYDVMAVAEGDFTEQLYTKRLTLDHFAPALND